MIRRIIQIDKEKCNGCGACAAACHEGAIGMVDGRATLLREDYCDGLGDCLPACPTGAISFETREAPAYDEAAVLRAKQEATEKIKHCGCPGTRPKVLRREVRETVGAPTLVSRLAQWPCQIKLVPVSAPYLEGANLLIAADCTAYAYGNFHRDFMAGKITVIACPKLDMVDYSNKLTEVFKNNDILSVTVTRMTVPCCGGLPFAVQNAIRESGKDIPLHIVTIDPRGQIQ